MSLFSHIRVAFTGVKNAQLIQAAKDGNLPTVQTLLAEGANINAKDNHGQTALFMAAFGGHTEIVKLLLGKGADVNAKDNDGATGLMIAALSGRTEIVKLLLEKGADINAKTTDGKWTALGLAKSKGHSDIVRLLEKAGDKAPLPARAAETGVSDKKDITPIDSTKTGVSDKNAQLIQAAKNGNLPAVKTLIANGADVNARDKNGVPILHWAVDNVYTELFKLLLEKGADVNIKKTDTGITALLIASTVGHWERTSRPTVLERRSAVRSERFGTRFCKPMESPIPTWISSGPEASGKSRKTG